jgi:hypothetical protein
LVIGEEIFEQAGVVKGPGNEFQVTVADCHIPKIKNAPEAFGPAVEGDILPKKIRKNKRGGPPAAESPLIRAEGEIHPVLQIGVGRAAPPGRDTLDLERGLDHPNAPSPGASDGKALM